MDNLELFVARDKGASNAEVFHSPSLEMKGNSFYSTGSGGGGGFCMNEKECIRDFGFFPEPGEAWHCTLSDDQSFWWIEKVEV